MIRCLPLVSCSALLLALVSGEAVPAAGQQPPPADVPAPRPAATPPPPAVASADSAARVSWLRRHAAPIRSIDPADEEFADLAPIGRAIGDARVVLLGEPSHTTGNLFHAQTRLVKYLHQQHGFDVLVFESGLYDVAKAWEAIRAGESAVAAFRASLYGPWSRPAEMRPLMDYVAERARTERPLELAGYDGVYSGVASYRHLVPDLQDYLRSRGAAERFEGDSVLWAGFRRLHWWRAEGPADPPYSDWPDAAELAPFTARLARLRQEMTAHEADPRGRFWQQVLESVAEYARQVPLQAADPQARDWAPFWNVRDAQGGRNLVWLADDRYRGRKLIVWLATLHAARNLEGIDGDEPPLARLLPAGHHAWQALGPQMYTLGMVALEGTSGWAGRTWPIVADQVPEAELEELLAEAGFELAFLDYRSIPPGGEWLRGPLVSRPFGNIASRARSWPAILDGLLFVRTGTPATWAEPAR
jgi:erythromycin esterase